VGGLVTEIRIGEYSFPTKKAAIIKIRGILHTQPHGVALTGDDADFITALLGLHPEADEKIGAGIEHITVRVIDGGTTGFWIVRIDGTCDDFSYIRCLNGDNHRLRVLKAMRRCIEDQILDYRRTTFTHNPEPICPLTGVVLTNDPTTHVDHHNPTFVELAEMYANTIGGFDSITVVNNKTHPGPQLVPPHLINFPQFHRHHATLRLTHCSANLARTRKHDRQA
jgi:hypothetical protein